MRERQADADVMKDDQKNGDAAQEINAGIAIDFVLIARNFGRYTARQHGRSERDGFS